MDQKNLAATLDWYHMSGVDVIVADHPTDWFEISKHPPAPSTILKQAPVNKEVGKEVGKQTSAPASKSPSRAPEIARKTTRADHRFAAPKTEQAVLEARQLSAKANNMQELQAALAGFEGCSLKNMAKNTCFADGNPQSSVMLIGEAPGRDEDLAGIPFVGPAGQLLDKMLQAAKLDRQQVWITNTVFWRPPGNRPPTQAETDICRPFLERQIDLIKPKVIMALGGTSAKALLQTKSGIMRLRGKWHDLEIAGQAYQLLPTLHPTYLLRTPAAKKLAWHDLLMMMETLAQEK